MGAHGSWPNSKATKKSAYINFMAHFVYCNSYLSAYQKMQIQQIC
jgi:hypothetical protein